MAARRYWFALAVGGVLPALSLPLYLTKGSSCPPPSAFDVGASSCSVGIESPQGILGSHDLAHPGWLTMYWLFAGLVGAGLVTWWYRRSAGGRRAVPFLAVLVLLAAVTAVLTASGWNGFHSPAAWAELPLLLLFNGATPLLVLAPALLALAVAERSVPLAVFALGFGGVAYVFATYDSFYLLQGLGVPLDIGNDPAGIRQVLNIAIPAAVLLLAAGAALASGLLRAPAGESDLQQGPAG